jgi:hypothetical protein
MPKAAPAVTPREFLRLKPPSPIDELVLHYDILKPHHKRFGSHAADPSTAVLHSAQAIAFFTLRTTPARLAAQLGRRIDTHEEPPKKLRELQPLYEDDRFVAHWYDRWFEFVAEFRDVTTGNYIVHVDEGYRLTPVTVPPA